VTLAKRWAPSEIRYDELIQRARAGKSRNSNNRKKKDQQMARSTRSGHVTVGEEVAQHGDGVCNEQLASLYDVISDLQQQIYSLRIIASAPAGRKLYADVIGLDLTLNHAPVSHPARKSANSSPPETADWSSRRYWGVDRSIRDRPTSGNPSWERPSGYGAGGRPMRKITYNRFDPIIQNMLVNEFDKGMDQSSKESHGMVRYGK